MSNVAACSAVAPCMLMFFETRFTRPRRCSSNDRRTGSVTPPLPLLLVLVVVGGCRMASWRELASSLAAAEAAVLLLLLLWCECVMIYVSGIS